LDFGQSLVVVPRTANEFLGMSQALDLAGASARWLSDGSIEVEGTAFAIKRVKIVRENDAVLLATNSRLTTECRRSSLPIGYRRPGDESWAVAEEWNPRWHPMPKAPPPDPPDRFRLSGTLGAVSLGVPLVAGPDGAWPKLYVADDIDLATVVGAYGARSGWTGSEIAVCPSLYGFGLSSTARRDGFIVASHLIIAFDLAQDRARGREILECWNPREPVRVW
jgi:hypothetical protein